MNAGEASVKIYSTCSLTRRSGSPTWTDLVHSSIGGVGVQALGDDDAFHGRLTSWQLGCLDFVLVNTRGVSVRATPDRTATTRSTQKEIWLGMCLAGRYEIGCNSGAVGVDPGRIAVLDPSRRRSMTFAAACELLWVRVPRVFVGANPTEEPPLIIDGTRGAGRLVQRTLLEIVDLIRDEECEDCEGIAEGVIRLISAALTPLRRTPPASVSAHRASALQRVKQYVQRNLGVHSLSLQTVSDALSMSPRYINKLFESERTSLMRWVWSRRLEGAHLSLQSGGGRRVSEIAYAFGFKNMSHFSHAFRARYGVAPSDVKRISVR